LIISELGVLTKTMYNKCYTYQNTSYLYFIKQHKLKNTTMKREFQIFKQGMTSEKVTILSNSSESFDRNKKIKWFLYLGYQVF